jgi:hypothetical protein
MAAFIVFVNTGRLDGQWSWSVIILHSVVAAGIYAVLFLISMDREERDWYFNKVKEVFKRRPVANAANTPTDLSMPS